MINDHFNKKIGFPISTKQECFLVCLCGNDSLMSHFFNGKGHTMNSQKLKLYGFNNLTKTLSFNIFDICYVENEKQRNDYIEYIDEQYNSVRLTNILFEVTEIIGATVLNVSKQDYDPQGASVTLLISEEPLHDTLIDPSCRVDPRFLPKESIAGHLDKSHLTVHTYPEYHPGLNIATFRVDIDVSTCGKVSPLKALNHLITSFDSDIISLDYRVRGFTRDEDGRKLFIDHPITSIQNYIDPIILKKYDAQDVNVYQSNIFHTKMLISEIELANYLFGQDPKEYTPKKRLDISNRLYQEMIEIYSGTNVYEQST
jgi:S-adenosylmethionine decarboxylase